MHAVTTSPELHVTVEMTGSRAEDTRRRAVAIQTALNAAAVDPLIKLRMALGRAYSASHLPTTSRAAVIAELRQTLDDPEVADIAQGYHGTLATLVAARTHGNRCGCEISATQLELLNEALALPEITDV